jgi:hypothetical protein
MNTHVPLTPEQVEAAWCVAYRLSLDDHPDSEIQWEAQTWRTLGVETVAAIAESLLAERRADDFVIPGGMDVPDLDRLLAHVNLPPVLRLCRDEALCLLAATRLVFWAGLREGGS